MTRRPKGRIWHEAASNGVEESERDEQEGRGQCEAGPGGERAGVSGARQADGDSDLAGGRPRQELAEGDEIRIGAVFEPFAPHHELFAEITEMRHRPAKRRQAEAEECGEHLMPVSVRLRRDRRRGLLQSAHRASVAKIVATRNQSTLVLRRSRASNRTRRCRG